MGFAWQKKHMVWEKQVRVHQFTWHQCTSLTSFCWFRRQIVTAPLIRSLSFVKGIKENVIEFVSHPICVWNIPDEDRFPSKFIFHVIFGVPTLCGLKFFLVAALTLYCQLPDEGILAMYMLRLQFLQYMDLHKNRGNNQPQSLFQFMASNFSTRLGLFAGFFHCSWSQSGHCSLPVGFLSHSLLSRACLAPSVSGTTCTAHFETMFQHFNQGSHWRDKLMKCAPLSWPEADKDPEQEQHWKESLGFSTSLLVGSKRVQPQHLANYVC